MARFRWERGSQQSGSQVSCGKQQFYGVQKPEFLFDNLAESWITLIGQKWVSVYGSYSRVRIRTLPRTHQKSYQNSLWNSMSYRTFWAPWTCSSIEDHAICLVKYHNLLSELQRVLPEQRHYSYTVWASYKEARRCSLWTGRTYEEPKPVKEASEILQRIAHRCNILTELAERLAVRLYRM